MKTNNTNRHMAILTIVIAVVILGSIAWGVAPLFQSAKDFNCEISSC